MLTSPSGFSGNFRNSDTSFFNSTAKKPNKKHTWSFSTLTEYINVSPETSRWKHVVFVSQCVDQNTQNCVFFFLHPRLFSAVSSACPAAILRFLFQPASTTCGMEGNKPSAKRKLLNIESGGSPNAFCVGRD